MRKKKLEEPETIRDGLENEGEAEKKITHKKNEIKRLHDTQRPRPAGPGRHGNRTKLGRSASQTDNSNVIEGDVHNKKRNRAERQESKTKPSKKKNNPVTVFFCNGPKLDQRRSSSNGVDSIDDER